MSREHVATAEVRVDAPREDVWRALTDPDTIAGFMMGARVETTWSVGSPITWRGEFDGNAFHDTGKVLTWDPPRILEHTHRSGGVGDERRVRYELVAEPDQTVVRLWQDNNATPEAATESATTWTAMLEKARDIIEARAGSAAPSE